MYMFLASFLSISSKSEWKFQSKILAGTPIVGFDSLVSFFYPIYPTTVQLGLDQVIEGTNSCILTLFFVVNIVSAQF